MRTFLALALLAGAAAPALAGPGDTIRSRSDREGRHEARSEAKSEAREARSERSARNDDNERPHRAARSAPARDIDAPRARSLGGVRHGRPDGGEAAAIQPSVIDKAAAPDTVREWRREQRRSAGPKIVMAPQLGDQPTAGLGDRSAPTLRQSERRLPAVFRNRVPVVSNTPREGTQPPLTAQHRSRHRDHWDSNWRRDRRYDWNRHRHRHRSLFHLGFYYDPFGWSYRPYSIGWRMWPSYYSSRYWLHDPWRYRLPYAPAGYRWIRYWDDAVLVDTFTGEVVDVIHNFFW